MQFGHNSGCVARADEPFCQALDTPSRRPSTARTAEIDSGGASISSPKDAIRGRFLLGTTFRPSRAARRAPRRRQTLPGVPRRLREALKRGKRRRSRRERPGGTRDCPNPRNASTRVRIDDGGSIDPWRLRRPSPSTPRPAKLWLRLGVPSRSRATLACSGRFRPREAIFSSTRKRCDCAIFLSGLPSMVMGRRARALKARKTTQKSSRKGQSGA